MPMDHVVISAMRSAKSISLFMVSSGETSDKRIDIAPNGIRWVERNFEQRMMLGNYFVMGSQNGSSNIDAMETDSLDGEATVLSVGVHEVKDKSFDVQTFDVGIENLKLTFDETTARSIHCSHCRNELVSLRKFSPLTEIPIYTMQPNQFFYPPDKPPVVLVDNQMYYGLNHIVISPKLFHNRIMLAENHNVHCDCCLQLVGEILSPDTAVLLFADTIRMAHESPEDKVPETVIELFQPTTPEQVMLRLLHDAVPISFDKTRLFLKTVRPDGQLHYLLLSIDINQVHLLRSNYDLSKELDAQLAGGYRAESVNPATGGNVAAFLPIATITQAGAETSDPSDPSQEHHVVEVKLQALRGYRINYQTFYSDDELSAGHETFMLWRNMFTPMLRVSFKMMLDLINALDANEQIAMSLERLTPPEVVGRLGYLIFETSKQEQPINAEMQADELPTEGMQDDPIKHTQCNQMEHEQLQLEQKQDTPHTSASSSRP